MSNNAQIYDRVKQAWVDVIPDGLGGFGDISSQRFLGRDSAGIGAVEVLDMQTAKRMLGIDDLLMIINNMQQSINSQAGSGDGECCCVVNNVGLGKQSLFFLG